MKQIHSISSFLLIVLVASGLNSCASKAPEKPIQQTANISSGDCQFYVDPDWVSDDPEKQFTYGLIIRPPWEDAGEL